MNRNRVYIAIVAWTSPILLLLMWLQFLTGLGTLKGATLRAVTLGLIDPAYAGKLHTVWLTLGTGLLVYLHAILGLQILVRRLRWFRAKGAWEVAVFVLGALMLAQFLVLYWA